LRHSFYRQDSQWITIFQGNRQEHKNLRGFHYYKLILEKSEIDTLQVESAAGFTLPTPTKSFDGSELPISEPTSTLQMIDDAEIGKIQSLIEDHVDRHAESTDIFEREELEEQISQLRHYLSGSVDHTGKPRPASSDIREKTRLRIHDALGNTLDKIRTKDPALAEYLAEHVKINRTALRYQDRSKPEWVVFDPASNSPR
jgi:hypothetical protein